MSSIHKHSVFPSLHTRLSAFVAYTKHLRGSEASDSQVFLDRFFQAFGYAGCHAVGAVYEQSVPVNGNLRYIDLLWGDRVLFEMKSCGVNLATAGVQLFTYWINLTPNKPRYAVSCNFDEFWIYDFNLVLDRPLFVIPTYLLADNYTCFSFMFNEPSYIPDASSFPRGLRGGEQHSHQLFMSTVKHTHNNTNTVNTTKTTNTDISIDYSADLPFRFHLVRDGTVWRYSNGCGFQLQRSARKFTEDQFRELVRVEYSKFLAQRKQTTCEDYSQATSPVNLPFRCFLVSKGRVWRYCDNQGFQIQRSARKYTEDQFRVIVQREYSIFLENLKQRGIQK